MSDENNNLDSIHHHFKRVDEYHQNAQRYRWLKEHMTVVLCEGKTTECYSKYMLPRLMAESRSGEKYTLDEIIDMKMGEEGI